jgi:alpha-L-rhamnosidase
MKMRALILLLFLSLTSWAQSSSNIGKELRDKMIWSGVDDGKPGYTVFRKTLDINNFVAASICVFADARYILWINGKEILRGPCRFDPVSPSFDQMDITSLMNSGKNAIVIMVMSHGSNGKMMNHHPGLTACIEIRDNSSQINKIWTDSLWKWNNHTRFLPPVQFWGVVCDRIDARIDDGDWSQTKYDDNHWPSAVSVQGEMWGPLSAREIPFMAENKMNWVPLNKNRLPVKLGTGQSYTIKADKMIQGFPIIQFEAEEGAVLQFELGYSGDSTDVRDTYRAVCFYTARKGYQEYTPTDSYGFRYINIKVLSGFPDPPFNVVLKQVKLIDRRYPYLETGSFESNDIFLNDLWKRSALTTKLNCEDGYMDCALREKTEWMGDAALIQYPLSRCIFAIPDSLGVPVSDHKLIKSLLRHIAQSQSDSGMFKAHHPSDRFDIHAYIEDYSCLWVQAMRHVYELTGDSSFVYELWEPLKRQMKWFEDHRSSNGLIFGREFAFFDNPLAYYKCNGATLNAFVYKAFLDASFLATITGDIETGMKYEKIAGEILKCYNKYLWIPSKKSYSSGISNGKQMMPTSHSALMALNRCIVPENRKRLVHNYLFKHYKDNGRNFSHDGGIPELFFEVDLPVKGIDSPYNSFWMLEELYKNNRDKEALGFIREKWNKMMKDTVTGTLMEGFSGGDFCHNNGAIPAYFLSSEVLGVSEKLPIDSKIIDIKPMLGDLTSAEGTVVTVHGPVHVKWLKQDDDLSFYVDIPKGTQAFISLPYNRSCKNLIINDIEAKYRIKKESVIFTSSSKITEGIYK